MSTKEPLNNKTMNDAKGGNVYESPTITEVTEEDFTDATIDSSVIACRSLLGT